MIASKLEFSKLLLVSDRCFVLILIPYCIILRYIESLDNWLVFLDLPIQICVSQIIDLICGLVLIF